MEWKLVNIFNPLILSFLKHLCFIRNRYKSCVVQVNFESEFEVNSHCHYIKESNCLDQD